MGRQASLSRKTVIAQIRSCEGLNWTVEIRKWGDMETNYFLK